MKKKSCNTCNWRFDVGRPFPIFHQDNENDVEMAGEYCESHTFTYGDECEPLWCEECKHLTKYQVTIGETSKENPSFDKRK
tara:strand:- start:199 stop:441 length:243 start_codon:yes stop_codon:yes gene_type:complete